MQGNSSKTVIQCLRSIFSLCGVPSYIHLDRGLGFLARDEKEYLLLHEVNSSKTTLYYSQGNVQVERYNGIIWKTICQTLKSQNLPLTHWESVLPRVLHSIRSSLSPATNANPHGIFFSFFSAVIYRYIFSVLVAKTKSCLSATRHSKNDPLVQEVELLEVNPTYAHIRYGDDSESSVSLHDQAPCPSKTLVNEKSGPDSTIKYCPS